MTVKELITALEKMPEDKIVVLTEPNDIYWDNIGEVIEDGSTVKITMDGNHPFEDQLLHTTAACMKRNGLDALNFQHKMNYNRNMNFEYTTETIMFYTRCYNQYGKLPQMLD